MNSFIKVDISKIVKVHDTMMALQVIWRGNCLCQSVSCVTAILSISQNLKMVSVGNILSHAYTVSIVIQLLLDLSWSPCLRYGPNTFPATSLKQYMKISPVTNCAGLIFLLKPLSLIHQMIATKTAKVISLPLVVKFSLNNNLF